MTNTYIENHIYYTTEKDQSQDNKVINLYKKHSAAAFKRTVSLTEAYMKLYKATDSHYYLRRAEAVKSCHDFALFRKYLDPDDTTELKKLNRCKNSLCTFCNWVDAKKRYSILAATIEKLKNEGYKCIHCVITVPNCNIEELQEQINNLHKIIAKTLRHFKVNGYYRSTEISYNKKNNTYHPHAHILITDYINIYQLEEFTGKEYKKLMPGYDKTYTICYISKCNYVKELCKYITKPNDYNVEQLQDMIQNDAIYKVRKYASGGIIKATYKETETLIKTLTTAKRTELTLFGFYDMLVSLG